MCLSLTLQVTSTRLTRHSKYETEDQLYNYKKKKVLSQGKMSSWMPLYKRLKYKLKWGEKVQFDSTPFSLEKVL